MTDDEQLDALVSATNLGREWLVFLLGRLHDEGYEIAPRRSVSERVIEADETLGAEFSEMVLRRALIGTATDVRILAKALEHGNTGAAESLIEQLRDRLAPWDVGDAADGPLARLRELGQAHREAAAPSEAATEQALDRVLGNVNPEDLAEYLNRVERDVDDSPPP